MELPACEVEHSRCANEHDKRDSSPLLAENLRHGKQEERAGNDQRANLDPRRERHQAGEVGVKNRSGKMDQDREPTQHPQPSPLLAVT